MSTIDSLDPTPPEGVVAIEVAVIDAGPFGELPYLTGREVRLHERLDHLRANPSLAAALGWLSESTGAELLTDRVNVQWRAAGVKRPGVVAQLSWPRFSTRLALGIETPLAHALVDRLLGYERLPEEGRLQVTPVEWGILTFVVAETISRLDECMGALGPCDFLIDRVGPDPFRPEGLGAIVTLRWSLRVGIISGSIRCWLPESLLNAYLSTEPGMTPVAEFALDAVRGRYGELASTWCAEAGQITLAKGLARVRTGGVVPIDGATLGGTPQTPTGSLSLALREPTGRVFFHAEAVPDSGGRLLKLTLPLRKQRLPREALPVSTTPDFASAESVSPADMPVTLTVELGRVNLPLHRIADLKPGDVIELGRHAHEPVELTSNGKLVARGELVQIDTELGVRLLSVFL
ncbi:MAG TPA: FliM/FliN family flagellar motor switch protein [Isosphaeraceae bacterium]|nr:FliM/FliN family flagellar motor switch protein [Isosphaeraceae bacterium]